MEKEDSKGLGAYRRAVEARSRLCLVYDMLSEELDGLVLSDMIYGVQAEKLLDALDGVITNVDLAVSAMEDALTGGRA